MNQSARNLRLLIAAAAVAVLAACANIGHPEGGPRDELPPEYVGSNPRMGQLNVRSPKITIDFNENITLDDAMNKIVVSPAQRTQPMISSNGRRITMELRDTLLPNTTYTIDLSDAVKDLNEGNVLDGGVALYFSTGTDLDTLQISGYVCEARTLEPAQGIVVGAHTVLEDTAIFKVPFMRITKTNQLGQFTLRNLKAGRYRLFALKDMNRDYKWDRSEDVAFYDSIIVPTAERATFTDTIVSAAGKRDSVVTFEGTRFLPDDVLLTWFNEGYSAQYLKDYSRPEHKRLSFSFGAKADTLPIIKLLNTARRGEDISKWAVLDASKGLDSLNYWITDTTVIPNDTLLLEATYLRTDSTERLSPRTDTLKMIMRGNKTWAKLREAEAKKLADAAAKLEKRRKQAIERGDSTFNETLPKQEIFAEFKPAGSATQELNQPLRFTASTPVRALAKRGVKLERQVDTVWVKVQGAEMQLPDSLRPMEWVMPVKWEENTKYRLTVDSAAVTDIYGAVNREVSHEFTTKSEADYSSISFNIAGLDSVPAVVEILNGSDAVVAKGAVKGRNVTVPYLAPGTYYARLYLDADGDGEWTAGSLSDSTWRQPEQTFYYPKKINLKKNWTVDQTWNIYELPIDLQKPRELVKNKPKRRPGQAEENTSNQEDETEEDELNSPVMDSNRSSRPGNPRLKQANRY